MITLFTWTRISSFACFVLLQTAVSRFTERCRESYLYTSLLLNCRGTKAVWKSFPGMKSSRSFSPMFTWTHSVAAFVFCKCLPWWKHAVLLQYIYNFVEARGRLLLRRALNWELCYCTNWGFTQNSSPSASKANFLFVCLFNSLVVVSVVVLYTWMCLTGWYVGMFLSFYTDASNHQ